MHALIASQNRICRAVLMATNLGHRWRVAWLCFVCCVSYFVTLTLYVCALGVTPPSVLRPHQTDATVTSRGGGVTAAQCLVIILLRVPALQLAALVVVVDALCITLRYTLVHSHKFDYCAMFWPTMCADVPYRILAFISQFNIAASPSRVWDCIHSGILFFLWPPDGSDTVGPPQRQLGFLFILSC